LKKILSVDPLLYDVNTEEALEFLQAVFEGVQNLEESLEEKLTRLEEKENEVTELKEKIEELEEKLNEFEANNETICVKVKTMEQRDKLEEFIKTEIYPYYNEQQANLTF
jgi:vacuolar-type H+-ATPase subunit E/Vma4